MSHMRTSATHLSRGASWKLLSESCPTHIRHGTRLHGSCHSCEPQQRTGSKGMKAIVVRVMSQTHIRHDTHLDESYHTCEPQQHAIVEGHYSSCSLSHTYHRDTHLHGSCHTCEPQHHAKQRGIMAVVVRVTHISSWHTSGWVTSHVRTSATR